MTSSGTVRAGFGPVDLYLLSLPGGSPDAASLAALTELTQSGLLNLLDLVLIVRSETGAITILEAVELPDGFEIDIADLPAGGLIGQEDVLSLAPVIPDASAALLVAVELVYQRDLAAKAAASGAHLLAYERIPAPVVNALVDSLVSEEVR